jgi:hypothetical protein
MSDSLVLPISEDEVNADGTNIVERAREYVKMNEDALAGVGSTTHPLSAYGRVLIAQLANVIEHRRTQEKIACLALINACHDGWSDPMGALNGYLRDAREAVENGLI